MCRADESGTTCANRRTYILYYKMKGNKIQRERGAPRQFLNAQAVLCCETNAVALYRRYPSLISNSSRKATSPSQRLSSKTLHKLPPIFFFLPSFKNLCRSIRFCSDECRRVVLPVLFRPLRRRLAQPPLYLLDVDRETFKRWPTAQTQRSYQFRTRTRQPSTSRFICSVGGSRNNSVFNPHNYIYIYDRLHLLLRC